MPENHPNQAAVFGMEFVKTFSDVFHSAAGGIVRAHPIAQGAVLGMGLGFNQAISMAMPPLPPHLVAPVGAVGIIGAVGGLFASPGLLPALGVAAATYAASQIIGSVYESSDTFKGYVDSFNEVVYDTIVDIAYWEGQVMRDLGDFAETLSNDIEVAKNQIADWIEDRYESLKDTLKQTYNDIGDGLDGALLGLRDFLNSVQDTASDILNGDYSNLGEDILDYLDDLLSPLGLGGGGNGQCPVSDPIGGAGGIFNSHRFSPLVFDLNGQYGLQLDPLEGSSVFYDLDNDGFAEQAGWTRTEGFLVRDANGNGLIDNQSEMFGLTAGGSAWDKLAVYDTNHDGSVAGTERGPLRMWIDADGDGRTDSGELKTLQQAGVASIDLTRDSDHSTVSGHEIDGMGYWTKTAGGTGSYYDVFFKVSQINAWYVGSDLANPPPVDVETLFLPLSRGYGSLKSLHLAMTEDAGLKAKPSPANDNKVDTVSLLYMIVA